MIALAATREKGSGANGTMIFALHVSIRHNERAERFNLSDDLEDSALIGLSNLLEELMSLAQCGVRCSSLGEL